MGLSCSSQLLKYLMFAFNLFFVLSAIIIIAVGATVKTVYTEYEYFLDSKYFTLPNMLIATGVLIFLISFLGCCGAFKESWIMLGIFSILLCIIFIFEFSAGIAGYVLRDRTLEYLDSTLRGDLQNYNKSHATWDLIQQDFECCGVDSYLDWEGKISNNSYELPLSCCPAKSGTVGAFYCNTLTPSTTASTLSTGTSPSSTTSDSSTSASTSSSTNPTTSSTDSSTNATSEPTTTSTTPAPDTKDPLLVDSNDTNSTTPSPSTNSPYPTGCKTAFGNYIKKHAVQIGGCAIGLAVIQLLGIAFSCHLVRQLKNGYYST